MRREGKKPQSLKKNTMVTTLGLTFASYILDLELKELANWKC